MTAEEGLRVNSEMKQLRKAVRKTKRAARWESIRSNPATPAYVVAGAVQVVWLLGATAVASLILSGALSPQGKVAGTLFTIAGLVGLSIPTWVIGVNIGAELKDK